ncbi:hypothetical protein CIPAW_15G030200 [Carya illinoinensis]|uniref:BTB domain-containing protein n=1 Tax=Carya illinoinensis TaxID=32201 RepID=A0A8T1NB33_CARIL|nr:hypothetical protein I3842_Q020800 [Carya illinoinensis]KAG6626177.1 hypothetical protein CIPAW_15G030200 [Carya illinoinensis]KAG6674157.1 hypothetical protein I3842_15G029100 [Carya illinoinensis]
MRCFSCTELYDTSVVGMCKECYEETNEMEEELKSEIDELRAKVALLKFWSPLDHHYHGRLIVPSLTSVVLVPSFDNPSTEPAVPFPAHKALLVSYSLLFRVMLENEMEESCTSTIKIGDVSYNALRAFVNYLYTIEACLDEQMACDLLVLAEKYQVKQLKAYCEKFLVSKLNWDNSIMSYAFAHQVMLDSALSLITDNMDKLTTKAEYVELLEKDPRLVVEIYKAYLSK